VQIAQKHPCRPAKAMANNHLAKRQHLLASQTKSTVRWCFSLVSNIVSFI
jgi:hypothetical protein